MSERIPIPLLAYLLGVSTSGATFIVWMFLRDIVAGVLDADYLLLFLPFAAATYAALSLLFGALPFYLLRDRAPAGGIARIAFIAFVLSPIISVCCLVGFAAVGYLQPPNPYGLRKSAPFLTELTTLAAKSWSMILVVMVPGALLMWAIDRFAKPL